MAQIEDFNSKKSELTQEDIFDMFIMFKSHEKQLAEFNLTTLMYSLPRWKNRFKLHKLYENIEIKKDDEGKEYVDLVKVAQEKVKERKLLMFDDDLFMILVKDDFFDKQKKQYRKDDLANFGDLMFYVNHDLEYGIGKWSIFAEDEVIKVPGYLPYITDEFFDMDKNDPKVKKLMIERAKKNLKNSGF